MCNSFFGINFVVVYRVLIDIHAPVSHNKYDYSCQYNYMFIEMPAQVTLVANIEGSNNIFFVVESNFKIMCFDLLYNFCPKHCSLLEEMSDTLSWTYIGLRVK